VEKVYGQSDTAKTPTVLGHESPGWGRYSGPW
jgi:hypothetical protein